MPLDVVIGLQRGDEGKGRFVDLIAKEYTVIARGNGGSNAGHTIVPDTMEALALHQVPSGITYPGKLNIIGNGVYVDPVRLIKELADVRATGIEVSSKNLLISNTSHLVFPHHIELDAIREGGLKAQGSTKSGISYVAADKFLREGLRLESIVTPNIMRDHALEGLNRVNLLLPEDEKQSQSEIEQIVNDWMNAVEQIKPFIADTINVVNEKLSKGENVLAEGAQAFWLDINHGMYPSVTSSSTTVSGLLDGLGLSAKHLGKVIGVAKAVKSHVGGGPFVTEILDEQLSTNVRGAVGLTDSEFGATTKRPRRIGYPDLVELRNSIRVNGVDELALSKLDHIPRYGKTVKIANSYTYNGVKCKASPSSALALVDCVPNYLELNTWEPDISGFTNYSDLPQEATKFVELFESELDVAVTRIGVGPGRSQVIERPDKDRT